VSTGTTPYMAVFGREATLPLQLIMEVPVSKHESVDHHVKAVQDKFQKIYQYMLKNQEDVIRRNSSTYHGTNEDWKVGDKLWYFCTRKVPGKPLKLTNGWLGPWEITRLVATVLVEIKPVLTEGKTRIVHVSRIRRFNEDRGEGNLRGRVHAEEDDDLDEAEEVRVGPNPAPPSLGIPVRMEFPQGEMVDLKKSNRDVAEEETRVPPTAQIHPVTDSIMDGPRVRFKDPPADMQGGNPPADMQGKNPPADMQGKNPPADMQGRNPPADKPEGDVNPRRGTRRPRMSSESEDSHPRQRPKLLDKARRLAESSMESTGESSGWESDIEMMTHPDIRVKLEPGSRIPVRGSLGAAAYDLAAAASCTLPAGRITKVDINLCLEIPDNYYLQCISRSGLAAKGVLTVAGTIDADYRGPVSILLFNLNGADFKISRGQRISSGVFLPRIDAVFNYGNLSKTGRGNAGFGSTGH